MKWTDLLSLLHTGVEIHSISTCLHISRLLFSMMYNITSTHIPEKRQRPVSRDLNYDIPSVFMVVFLENSWFRLLKTLQDVEFGGVWAVNFTMTSRFSSKSSLQATQVAILNSVWQQQLGQSDIYTVTSRFRLGYPQVALRVVHVLQNLTITIQTFHPSICLPEIAIQIIAWLFLLKPQNQLTSS
jgi:hypothetical protein